MTWLPYASYFLGGIVLGNAVPHFVSGTMGRAFQSPFAHPPGVGLSSALVNTVWSAANVAVGYVLVLRVGMFDLRDTRDAVAFGAGVLAIALFSAYVFGRVNGGNRESVRKPT
jgi:hypothetical protein